MAEFFSMAISGVNIIPTVLLILSLLYWLIAILGVIDIDGFDLGIDTDVDVEAEGFATHLLNFLNIGDVPITIYFSILFLSFWAFNMIVSLVTGSHGGQANLIGIVPCFVGAALFTKILIIPLKGLLKGINGNADESTEFIGMTGKLKFDIAPGKSSQVIITTGRSLLNCSVEGEYYLSQGDEVKVVGKNIEKNSYIVEPFQTLEA